MSSSDLSAEPREKSVAFIVARLSSSRLPAKQLKNIGNKPLLQWIIDSLQLCKELDQIVIATVEEESNLPLKNYAQQQNIPCFWYQGEVNHVTTRLRRAAEEYQADICLLISGDCPLVDTEAIDILVSQMRANPTAEVLRIETRTKTICMLEGVHIMRRIAWQRADDLSTRPEQKEHQFPVISQQSQLFSWHTSHLPKQFYAEKHRLSVDTLADLDFMNKLYDCLMAQKQNFNLENTLQLLSSEPSLRDINRHVYQRKLIEKENKVLFAIDASGEYGLGHLTRSTELAIQLIERKGWSATFLVDDASAQQYLEERGIKSYWGAFGRQPRCGRQPQPADLAALYNDHSMLIIDIFDQREPQSNWRTQLPTQISVVSLGNMRPWAEDADMLIMPGIGIISERIKKLERDGRIQLLQGLDNLILRREISKLQPAKKDLDLLVYLHNHKAQRDVENFIAKRKIRGIVLTNFTENIPQLMARTKLYISGFGTSSYEALALQAYPICWPHSDVNKRDALHFYEVLNLPPTLVEDSGQLVKIIPSLLTTEQIHLPKISDGTARLVEQISRLAH